MLQVTVKLSVKDLVRPFVRRDYYLYLSIECEKKSVGLVGQIRFDSVTYRRDGPLSRFRKRMFSLRRIVY